jgi:hypothetical protein
MDVIARVNNMTTYDLSRLISIAEVINAHRILEQSRTPNNTTNGDDRDYS